jgi:hypothetical protein
MSENLHYWQYFTALEEDFSQTIRFVELAEPNLSTYSVEFARIILSAGSEIDVLAKVLANRYGLTVFPQNIDGYRKAIMNRFPEFIWLKIMVPRFGIDRLPWRDWHDDKNPEWWRAYNDIKHERNANFPQANLGNALNCISGLFTLVCYLCQHELRSNRAVPWPRLLSIDPAYNSRLSTDLRPGYTLPDFRD